MGWEMPYTIQVPLLPRDAGVPNRRGTIQKRIDPSTRRDGMKVDHWGQG